MQSSKKTYTLQEATKKLERYCAYQERCHQEVFQKLSSMHMIPEAIDIIMLHLLEHDFLNEARFAKTYAQGKFKIKHWGKRRLAYELKKKDVSKVNINEALLAIDHVQYIEVFNHLTDKKVNSMSESNILKKKKKFIDYFLYRGWESHLVYEKANQIIK